MTMLAILLDCAAVLGMIGIMIFLYAIDWLIGRLFGYRPSEQFAEWFSRK